MLINRLTILVVATLSALFAGGGVIALAKARAPTVQSIPRSADGHFWADGTVASDTGKAKVHFLVDTGASSVALTAADAARLGLDPGRLIYSRPVYTAEGETRAASVMLSRLVVAGAEMREVKALVLQPAAPHSRPQTSLLGMSYLGRLSRMTATRESLVLEP